jgi:putative ABC transport system permease protein
MLFIYRTEIRSYYSLKVSGQDLDATVAAVEDAWKEVFPGNPYEFFFLDAFFGRQYLAEHRFGQVFGLFALLAVIVACLGLFGLAAFSAQQRTKEIGIRKVLGASVSGVVGLLSKEYAVLVLVANLLAWPVAYLVMHRWLQTFAYHIEPGVGTLAIAGIVTLLIACLTVSYNAFRAARTNPVEALRYE